MNMMLGLKRNDYQNEKIENYKFGKVINIVSIIIRKIKFLLINCLR